MGIFDKIKDTANQAKEMADKAIADGNIKEKINGLGSSIKESIDKGTADFKAYNEESKELKKALDGALARYEFTYIGGLIDKPKSISGAWGMNIMPDRFSFRVTAATKNDLPDMDILYDDITDARIEKRTISNTEMWLGGGNDANQEQENVFVIEYNGPTGKKETLRIEMLTGFSIYGQAAKCKEMMALLRREDILDKIQKGNNPASNASGAGEPDILGQLEKMAKLKDAGILSEEEFNAKKAELLAKL